MISINNEIFKELMEKEDTVFSKKNLRDKNFQKFIKGVSQLEPMEIIGVAKLLEVDISIMIEKNEDKTEQNKKAVMVIESCGRAFLDLIRSQQNRILKIIKEATYVEKKETADIEDAVEE